METVVVTTRVPGPLAATITELARRQGRTRANFIRQLLEKEAKEYTAMLAQYPQPKPQKASAAK